MAKILRNSLRSNSVEFFNAILPDSEAPHEAGEGGAPRRVGGRALFWLNCNDVQFLLFFIFHFSFFIFHFSFKISDFAVLLFCCFVAFLRD